MEENKVTKKQPEKIRYIEEEEHKKNLRENNENPKTNNNEDLEKEIELEDTFPPFPKENEVYEDIDEDEDDSDDEEYMDDIDLDNLDEDDSEGDDEYDDGLDDELFKENPLKAIWLKLNDIEESIKGN